MGEARGRVKCGEGGWTAGRSRGWGRRGSWPLPQVHAERSCQFEAMMVRALLQ